MWAKPLILAAFVAVGANVAPVDADLRLQAVAPNWVIPAQDRGGRQLDIRPLREVVEMLRARHGGELISARLEQGPRPIYVIRWRMPDGEVRDFRVDAAR
jgi:uncharacterized membrane protein YkoI